MLEPYPGDNNEFVKQTAQEWGYKPSLKSKIVNMKSYDVVFIGYPVWWNTISAPVFTFLSEYDLSEKTIVPFSTDYGKGLGRSVADITILCPESTVLNGFAVDRSKIETSQKKVYCTSDSYISRILDTDFYFCSSGNALGNDHRRHREDVRNSTKEQHPHDCCIACICFDYCYVWGTGFLS